MSRKSFDTVYFCYNFIEKYFIKDYQEALRLINKHLNLKKSQDLIDIGGGTGFIAASIIDKVNSITVVDHSKKMLNRLNNPLINKIQGNGILLPINDESFDIALLVNVLHHVKTNEQGEILKEIFRVLKKDGIAFILDLFFPKTFSNRIFNIVEEIAVGKTYHVPHDVIISKLKKIKFHDISLIYPDHRHWRYLIIAKKY